MRVADESVWDSHCSERPHLRLIELGFPDQLWGQMDAKAFEQAAEVLNAGPGCHASADILLSSALHRLCASANSHKEQIAGRWRSEGAVYVWVICKECAIASAKARSLEG